MTALSARRRKAMAPTGKEALAPDPLHVRPDSDGAARSTGSLVWVVTVLERA